MGQKRYVLEITPQDCYRVFEKWGEYTTNARMLVNNPEQIALVVFTGGSDVWPELYGENVGHFTHFDMQRDLYEIECFKQALEHKIPMVGICRGSQFLCVQAGGKLCQDIRNHGRHHTIRTHRGKSITCNSSHHQMQLPPDGAEVLAVADPKISSGHYLNGDNDLIEPAEEYEVIYYPNINAVGIQYHPEWLDYQQPCVIYAQEVVQEFLFG